MPKVSKAELSFFVHDTSSRPVLHLYQVSSKYSEGYLRYRAHTKSISNKTKGNNFKSKKARVVILVCDRPSSVLHFYQVSSKYSKYHNLKLRCLNSPSYLVVVLNFNSSIINLWVCIETAR